MFTIEEVISFDPILSSTNYLSDSFVWYYTSTNYLQKTAKQVSVIHCGDLTS